MVNKMGRIINKYDNNMFNNYCKVTYKCKCGHSEVIPYGKNKVLCSWCHHWVYRNKLDEFKDKLSKEIIKNERNKSKII